MATDPSLPDTLHWSAQLDVALASGSRELSGDKILLPASALQDLLATAPFVPAQSSSPMPLTATFDPFNLHTFSAERRARELQYQDHVQQLPHPLTFRLVNPDNGKVVYAGIREFSANDGEVVLSRFLRETLGIELGDDDAGSYSTRGGSRQLPTTEAKGPANIAASRKDRPRITVHAKQLPKGAYVRLRPLEAGYDPADWKSLLEQQLQANFTTLTNGEILAVQGKHAEFRFFIDGLRPEGDAVCVVDTDLEVDIEPLNEDQARETLRKMAEKERKRADVTGKSSTGGRLDLLKTEHGHVLDGEYVDYEIPSWIRAHGVEVELSGMGDADELDLYISPYGPRQRARPRADEHVFADTSSRHTKRLRLHPTDIGMEHAEALWVSVHAYAPTAGSASKSPKSYQIRVAPFDPLVDGDGSQDVTLSTSDVRCKNCHHWIPERAVFSHESFCFRNNILCPNGCSKVFQKRSEAFQTHWHCPHDAFYGDTPLSHAKHNALFHTPHVCDSCHRTFASLSELARHKTTVCPSKLILCQFCHLEVPQDGDPDEPSPEALLSGLTPHELADGSRTTECHLCGKIVRLRDMSTHLRHHELEKFSRPAPRLCRNANCGRTLDGGGTPAKRMPAPGPANDLGLCAVCFGPLYVSMHDPDGTALRRRVERKYLAQLTAGCGTAWCLNHMCKCGRDRMHIKPADLTFKTALPLVKPLLTGLLATGTNPAQTALYLCTDESSQTRRKVAEMLAVEMDVTGKGGYAVEWCVAALETEGGDVQKAREWLKGWAPQRNEVR